jgi:predicted SAM-dependent methyltransferase
MISPLLRRAYLALAYVPMRVSGLAYRWLAAPRAGLVKVHLGPGKGNYLPGWINLDANIVSAKVDVWADLTGKLPFRDGTVDVFYSHHVIEHLPDRSLPRFFADMYRCLKPGGCIRVAGPDAFAAAKKLVEGDIAWFSSDFPDRRASIGGRFANFLLCGGEHLTLLTESYLRELAAAAGFVDIERQLPTRETRYPRLIDEAVLGKEWENDLHTPHTLVIEARKPEARSSS